MWIVVTVSALFVYYDASKNNIGSIPGETGFTNADAGMWATSTLLLWIIAFPIYLLNRSQLIEKANANPKEPSKGRSVIIIYQFNNKPRNRRFIENQSGIIS
jgi:hypothetical protein